MTNGTCEMRFWPVTLFTKHNVVVLSNCLSLSSYMKLGPTSSPKHWNFTKNKTVKGKLRHWLTFNTRPGPNFIELLSTNICLAWNFFPKKIQDYQPNFHLLHPACYWYSALVCWSWKLHGHLVGDPVFVKEEISC